MNESEIIKILKLILLSNLKPYGQESLTEILALSQAKNKNITTIVRNNFYNLMDYIAILRGEQIAKLYIAKSVEQIDLINNLCLSINTKKIDALSSTEITQKINTELKKEKSVVQINEISEIKNVIARLQRLERVRRGCRLIYVYNETLEILPYCKKYIILNPEDLSTDMSILEKSVLTAKVLMFDNEETKKIATEYLTKKNYPLVAIQNKNGNQLREILEKHYLAAVAVKYLHEAQKKPILTNQNDLLDIVALFLLDQADIGAIY